MKLIAVTYGTEGDTRPLAALCRALMDAGHEATLLADGGALGTARDLGVPHLPLAGDMRGTLSSGTGIASVLNQPNAHAVTKALARIANENALPWMRQTLDAARNCDALITAGLAAFIGLSVAECLHIRAIGAGMFPMTPTSAFPSPFLPPRRVPRWFNRLSHRLVIEALWRAFRKATNDARAQVACDASGDMRFDCRSLFGRQCAKRQRGDELGLHAARFDMQLRHGVPDPSSSASRSFTSPERIRVLMVPTGWHMSSLLRGSRHTDSRQSGDRRGTDALRSKRLPIPAKTTTALF
jgi:hypothetical protein